MQKGIVAFVYVASLLCLPIRFHSRCPNLTGITVWVNRCLSHIPRVLLCVKGGRAIAILPTQGIDSAKQLSHPDA